MATKHADRILSNNQSRSDIYLKAGNAGIVRAIIFLASCSTGSHILMWSESRPVVPRAIKFKTPMRNASLRTTSDQSGATPENTNICRKPYAPSRFYRWAKRYFQRSEILSHSSIRMNSRLWPEAPQACMNKRRRGNQVAVLQRSVSFNMIKAAIPIVALLHVASVYGAVPAWGQCGGIGYTGETVCVSGYACTYSNDWYSQCLASGATSTSSTSTTKVTTSTTSSKVSSTTTTTTKSTTSSTSTKPTTSTTTSKLTSTTSTSSVGPTATGFVKTSGQKFTLNGSTYIVVGENAYYIPQLPTTADINQAFAEIAATGATTVRTLGFNEVTSPSGTYYHLWSGATATLNTGADGLGKFDTVIAAAKANGLRLIIPLTNNWSDYGGMDVYVKQILGSTNHDLFYTDASVIAAFKTYVNGFVSRYINEPTVLAWELANEPRCTGSTGISTGTCTTTTITNWVKTISAYIKSIDPNHLVTIGDEGFGLPTYGTDYVYTTGPGLDFAANLAISTIDFGTFHLYPESWGGGADSTGWGNTWINAHAAVQKSIGKPVILEEFGVTSNQTAVYTSWYSTVVSSGLAGDLIWQAGTAIASAAGYQDAYAIAPTNPTYQVIKAHAAALKARG